MPSRYYHNDLENQSKWMIVPQRNLLASNNEQSQAKSFSLTTPGSFWTSAITLPMKKLVGYKHILTIKFSKAVMEKLSQKFV